MRTFCMCVILTLLTHFDIELTLHSWLGLGFASFIVFIQDISDIFRS